MIIEDLATYRLLYKRDYMEETRQDINMLEMILIWIWKEKVASSTMILNEMVMVMEYISVVSQGINGLGGGSTWSTCQPGKQWSLRIQNCVTYYDREAPPDIVPDVEANTPSQDAPGSSYPFTCHPQPTFQPEERSQFSSTSLWGWGDEEFQGNVCKPTRGRQGIGKVLCWLFDQHKIRAARLLNCCI